MELPIAIKEPENKFNEIFSMITSPKPPQISTAIAVNAPKQISAIIVKLLVFP
jgi:hypothetical protein